MARLIPFNRTGIVGLRTIASRVESETLIFEFEAHPYVNTPFNGLLLIHFETPAPSGTTGTMPIYFETRGMLGSRKAVKKAGGVPLTAADITVPCYMQFFYDNNTGVVEAVQGVI